MNKLKSCFICNSAVPNDAFVNIFQCQSSLECSNDLPSLLSTIISKPVKEEGIYSDVLCETCHDHCLSYDIVQAKLNSIKTTMLDKFKTTLSNRKMSYTTYGTSQDAKNIKKIVLPASKLMPLPSGFVLNMQKAQADNSFNFSPKKPVVLLSDCVSKNDSETIVGKATKLPNLPPLVDHPVTVTATRGKRNTSYILRDENTDASDNENNETMEIDEESPSQSNKINNQENENQNKDAQNKNNGSECEDEQDSNDESQIELQMSGDEETANAIIAAANQQGGAFIKVESGEMYRVQSVHSKAADDIDNDDDNEYEYHPEPEYLLENDSDLENVVSVEKLGNGQFRCMLCYKKEDVQSTGDSYFISHHLKDVHYIKIYVCSICSEILNKKSEYTQHLAAMHGKASGGDVAKKLHECNICNKMYNSKTLLTEHMNKHTGHRPYKCNLCPKTFASKYTHNAHLKTHEIRSRPFRCVVCGKSFFTAPNLQQHARTHVGQKDFTCLQCGKSFSTQHNLSQHDLVHSGERAHECTHCGKCFARRAELQDHTRIHTGERPFRCDICDATFAQRSNLHSHRRSTHFGERKHACTQCDKKFKRRRLLDYHMKAAHTGERPLKCGVCLATFVYPEHYKKHLRIHNGDKPYVCEICGKSFNSRDNRNTHRFVHSDKKPYECVVCGAGYMRKQQLYAHMNTSGHIAESIVVNQPRVHNVATSNDTLTVASLDELKEKFPDSIFETAELLETTNETSEAKLYITEDKKIILQNGQLNIMQGVDDPLSLTYQQLDADQLSDQTQLVTSDDGSMVRLVQIQLPDGNSGWVTIN